MLKPFVKNSASAESVSPARVMPAEVRQLIKEARLLKAVQHYDEACDKLIEAFSTKGAKDLSVKERLRLPRYMQVAGRTEEGWKLLNNMLLMNANDPSQADIADEMWRFMCREKNYRQALPYAAWAACKRTDRDDQAPNLLPDTLRERVHPIANKINLTHKIENFTKELSEHMSATKTLGLDELKAVVDRHFV
jgi:hypothetical protein